MIEIEGCKVEFENSLIEELVKKHQIDFESNNKEIRDFLFDFYPLLEQNGYKPRREDFDIVLAEEDYCVPGRQGYCISDKNYGLIIIWKGHFKQVFEEMPEYRKDIVKSYIMCLLHELAHNVVRHTLGEDSKIEPHGEEWIKCAKLLGLEDKELYQ